MKPLRHGTLSKLALPSSRLLPSRPPRMPSLRGHLAPRRYMLLCGLAAGSNLLAPSPAAAYFRLNSPTDSPSPDNIFGKILRGEAPAEVLEDDDDELFSFRDKNPAAPIHYLVIPRRFVRDAAELTPHDDVLVRKMAEKARYLVRSSVADSFDESELVLGFHWPPWYSVPWLHLHAIYPYSKMKRRYKYTSLSFKSPEWVVNRLAEQRAGKHARGVWW
ncbi:hypothetical protein AB1Y20_023662 [Prymnesium parvum]|uniref:HIT domain-containing protein n=1 Tax=Prymnesium parvum TaxID=97485 RepID=A0AB34JHC0_PRYPA